MNKRNKAEWGCGFYNSINTIVGTTIVFIPTISLHKDTTDKEDCTFAICFEWLFWRFKISRYWSR